MNLRFGGVVEKKGVQLFSGVGQTPNYVDSCVDSGGSDLSACVIQSSLRISRIRVHISCGINTGNSKPDYSPTSYRCCSRAYLEELKFDIE
jgi:hypothetical protein